MACTSCLLELNLKLTQKFRSVLFKYLTFSQTVFLKHIVFMMLMIRNLLRIFLKNIFYYHYIMSFNFFLVVTIFELEDDADVAGTCNGLF